MPEVTCVTYSLTVVISLSCPALKLVPAAYVITVHTEFTIIGFIFLFIAFIFWFVWVVFRFTGVIFWVHRVRVLKTLGSRDPGSRGRLQKVRKVQPPICAFCLHFDTKPILATRLWHSHHHKASKSLTKSSSARVQQIIGYSKS
jgi:hypothetical protein